MTNAEFREVLEGRVTKYAVEVFRFSENYRMMCQ